MKHKVFVSYKYGDAQVQDLGIMETVGLHGFKTRVKTTARHYVDKLVEILGPNIIYKGENDGEDIGTLADTTISSKLGDKIFDSSVTIVLISKGMKDPFTLERHQWIPWEISYSLRKQSRYNRVSKTNGIIAVVLPDENNSYDYFMCYDSNLQCEVLKTSILFEIVEKNMFNKKQPSMRVKNGRLIYNDTDSYIQSVKWCNFILNPQFYIDAAYEKSQKTDEYNIVKNLT